MSRHTSNVIPFLKKPAHRTPSAPKSFARLKRLMKLEEATSRGAARSLPIPQAMAMGAATPDALPDPAIVARVVIGFARRKGKAMTSIPKPFREQLVALCVAGDPTARMLRDWLEGNRKLLAIDGMPELCGTDGTGESA